MKVKLLSHTPMPEKTVAAAAKLCYSAADIDDILAGLTEEKTSEFISMLSEIGHESPIEHVSFTFAIEGVSRSLTHQLVRHRIASYSQQSQRYVSENQFDFVIPPEIEAIDEAKEEFITAMKEAQLHYEKLTDILQAHHIQDMINDGVDEKKAKRDSLKKAIEDARFVLPNACDTKIIATFNARSLHNFFAHRCCNRAQWEIRELAIEMLKLVLAVAPNLFKKAGPGCVNGPCPEGKMCCGKTAEVRKKFKNLLAE